MKKYQNQIGNSFLNYNYCNAIKYILEKDIKSLMNQCIVQDSYSNIRLGSYISKENKI